MIRTARLDVFSTLFNGLTLLAFRAGVHRTALGGGCARR